MTLYWYMHWFWITTTLNLYGGCNEIINATTTHSTTMLATESHRFFKSVDPPTVTPPISTPARNKRNNTANSKQISVIEPNVTSAMHNFTYMNTTDNLTMVNVTDEGSSSSNESLAGTSERVAIADGDPVAGNLSAAGITGITLGCVSFVGILSAVGFIIYRNRGFNRPQVLSDRCSNLDSSGYIDDTSVRDNSEEMYSLDNDSFLNSLEAMTIQNYWTDTVKHTKL